MDLIIADSSPLIGLARIGQIRPCLEPLEQNGIYLARDLVAAVLKDAGE